MNRKLLVIGAVAAVGGLILLSGKAKAKAPPALPSPALRKVVELKPAREAVKVDASAPQRPQIKPSGEDAAHAAAAAAAASMSSAPSADAPMSMPAASPLGTVVPAAQLSVDAPSKPQLPGYDPNAARRGASAVANHLNRKGRAGYSRPVLKDWQKFAGLKSDGIYGGATRGALIHFGVSDPPPPFFKPTHTIPYNPPT